MKLFCLFFIFLTFTLPINSRAHWANESNSSCQSNDAHFFTAFSPGLLKNSGRKNLLHSFQEMERYFGACIALEKNAEGNYLLKYEEAQVPIELEWNSKKQIDKILLFKAEFPNDTLQTVESRLEKLFPQKFSAVVQYSDGKNAYAKNEKIELEIGEVQELYLLKKLGALNKKDIELVNLALLDKNEKAMDLLEKAFFRKEKTKYKRMKTSNVVDLCTTLILLKENAALKKIPSILAPKGWTSLAADSAWAPRLRQATEILQNESGAQYCFSFTVNSATTLNIERTQELFFRWFRMIAKEKL